MPGLKHITRWIQFDYKKESYVPAGMVAPQ
jgi:hypothetical protein